MKGAKRSREYGEGSPRKRKLDPIVANKIEYIDYKDVNLLRKFITENGKFCRVVLLAATPRTNGPLP